MALPNAGVVGNQLNTAEVPAWVWFIWIPQLLSSMQRPDANYVKPILQQLATHHPQSLYYNVRTLLLLMKDVLNRLANEMKHRQAKQAAAAAAAAKAAEEGSQEAKDAGGW